MVKKSGNMQRELIVKSSTENLTAVRNFISEFGGESGLSEETIGKVVLAVDEACTNIIKHAYNYSPDGDIYIKAKMIKSRLIVSIKDSGKTFNPAIVPEPDLKAYHRQKKGGGLGMFLMKKLMDEVDYTSAKDKRNQVTMVKYL